MLIGWMAPAQNIDTEPELIIVFDKNKIIPVGEAFPELLPEIQKVEQFGKNIHETKKPEEDITKYGNMQKEIFHKVYQKLRELTNKEYIDTLNSLWQKYGQKNIFQETAQIITIIDNPVLSRIPEVYSYKDNLYRILKKQKAINPANSIDIKTDNKKDRIILHYTNPNIDKHYKNLFADFKIFVDKAKQQSLKIGKRDKTPIFLNSIIYKEINKQCLDNGKLIKTEVDLYFEDIQKKMGFKEKRYARDFIINSILNLRSLISGIEIKVKNKVINDVIFGAYITDTKKIRLSLGSVTNTKENIWNNMKYFYIDMPDKFCKLDIKDYLFALTIYKIARQRTEEIKRDSYFEIKYRCLYENMNLPEIDGNNDTKKTIKDPIQKAITTFDNITNENDFYIEPKEYVSKNIVDFLDKSYLRVYPDKETNQKYTLIAKKKQLSFKKKPTKKDKI